MEVKVKPVAWVGNTPMKYQASATYYYGKNNAARRLFGDPQSNEDLAVKSLKIECELFKAMAEEAIRTINEGII